MFFSEGIKFIEENRSTPFFCHIALNAPRVPLNVEPKYVSIYEELTDENKARFYGIITNIDENFGKLRSKLSEFETEENTILIFMTDNGSNSGVEVDEDHL